MTIPEATEIVLLVSSGEISETLFPHAEETPDKTDTAIAKGRGRIKVKRILLQYREDS